MAIIDFHIHTIYSIESNIDRKKIMRSKLDGVCITDHNTMKGALKYKKEIKNKIIILGEEIKTKKGDLLGIFLTEEIKSRDPFEAIDEIKSQGGIAIAPHGYDIFRNGILLHKGIIKKIQGIEVFNSRCLFNVFNDKALKKAEEKKLLRTAGSDAHMGGEMGNAGMKIKGDTEEEIRKNLLKNKFEIFGKKSLSKYKIQSFLCKIENKNKINLF